MPPGLPALHAADGARGGDGGPFSPQGTTVPSSAPRPSKGRCNMFPASRPNKCSGWARPIREQANVTGLPALAVRGRGAGCGVRWRLAVPEVVAHTAAPLPGRRSATPAAREYAGEEACDLGQPERTHMRRFRSTAARSDRVVAGAPAGRTRGQGEPGTEPARPRARAREQIGRRRAHRARRPAAEAETASAADLQHLAQVGSLCSAPPGWAQVGGLNVRAACRGRRTRR